MGQKTKTLNTVHGYDITITGRHMLVTDAMKDYATDKISKIDRFSDQIINATVTMDIQKTEHKVSITLKVGHIKIQSQASSNDMYASIDKSVHKLESQLKKYKNKIQNHQAKSITSVDMNVNVFKSSSELELLEINDEIEDETIHNLEKTFKPHDIVKQETRPLKTLTYDEAIMKMDLSNDFFIVFRNEIDNKIKIIYRRDDSNYGVIEPE
jgi:putative sigma-54 modulation protein